MPSNSKFLGVTLTHIIHVQTNYRHLRIVLHTSVIPDVKKVGLYGIGPNRGLKHIIMFDSINNLSHITCPEPKLNPFLKIYFRKTNLLMNYPRTYLHYFKYLIQ